MEPREQLIQHLLTSGAVSDSLTYASLHSLDHSRLVGVIKSLQSQQLVTADPFEVQCTRLTEEGEQYLSQGSPEYQTYLFIQSRDSITQADLNSSLSVAKIGFGTAMKNGWISLDKQTKLISVTSAPVVDQTAQDLAAILAGSASASMVENLKKRKLCVASVLTSYRVTPLPGFSLEKANQQSLTDLTADLLISGDWQRLPMKPYNLRSLGGALTGGHLHPLLKVRSEIRRILLYMGFEEMPTQQWVESSFWNFDALFQGQQHAARDAHDTFYLTNPRMSATAATAATAGTGTGALRPQRTTPREYVEAVHEMHEKGGFGSAGYRHAWSEEMARQNILRTHTTAASTRVLYKLAQEYLASGEKFVGRKCFSIDRVFRNETLDATHLAEFHQVEGFVIDKNLTLRHLIGEISEFFRRLGMADVKFKPAYNPYTEPSMEIFAFHPGLDKWIEVGNSGIFRPEMLRPMGWPEDVQVIAWGLSVERPCMIQYGIGNIRDLFGYKMDFSQFKKNPVCWFQPATQPTTL